MMIIHPVAGDGGCWWPQLAGCRPTLGSIPLSVSRLAVMSIMSTLSSLYSLLVAAFLPVKFTLWKSGATKTKRGAKCQMSQTQIKYFQALLNQYLTFLRAVFRLSDILSVGVENWRVDIYGPFENNFQNKSFIFGLNIARNKQAAEEAGWRCSVLIAQWKLLHLLRLMFLVLFSRNYLLVS